MTKTNDNLKVAFAGESQANRKYLAFAKKPTRKAFHKSLNSSVRQLKQKQFTHTPICVSLTA
jgi:rubrerythrin